MTGMGTRWSMASSTVQRALPGVIDIAPDVTKVRVGVQGQHQQVEQPGADDGALSPRSHHAGDVLDHLGGVEQLEALGIGLHEAVLNAVVHHFREVARTDRPGVHEAGLALGLEGVEEGLHRRHVLGRTADHERIAVVEPPHPAGHARVHIADAVLAQVRRVLVVVGVAGVAAVHDDVAGLEQPAELVHRGPRGVAGRAPSPTRRGGRAAP